MESFLQAVQDLSDRDKLIYGLVSMVTVSRLSYYRQLKYAVAPICGLVIVYRFFYIANSKSFSQMIVEQLHAVGNPAMQTAIGDIVGLVLFFTAIRWINCLMSVNFRSLPKDLIAWGYNAVRKTGPVQAILQKEQDKIEKDFDDSLKVKARALGPINNVLPKKGWKKTAIMTLMKEATQEEDKIWEAGKVSGAVYHGQHKHIDLLNEAFSKYSISNPLHADIWPSVMKFESEIVAMTAAMVNNGVETVCGCTTSGGTESIILAIKAHRDFYRELHGITEPEMIACTSAHAAVDKGCDLMGIKLIKVPMDPKTFRINMSAARAAIGPNTILMYASAPSYPQGVIDPIREMGQLAVTYGFGLHVDCCLGGFVLPFAKKLGYNVPDFEFSVPGVSSMSLDTHKYGYALKGTSVVLYRTKELRHAQYFTYSDWTGGMYTTPTIAGSRSGGIIAQCWASMMSMGQDGYEKHVDGILKTCHLIADGVKEIPGLELCGYPQAMVVCFRGALLRGSGRDDKRALNIYSVGDKMSKRGWSLNPLQNPACIHLCCTFTHVGRHEQFLRDLRQCTEEVLAHPEEQGSNATIYGMTSALPAGPVNELLKVYNDVVLKC